MDKSVVETLDDYIAFMDDNDGWTTLFTKLHQDAVRNMSPCTVAKEAESKTRNRYRDVLPADQSRVSLEVEGGQCDYINANFVEIEDVGRQYILTQGPLPHTAEHFWQMVWEKKSKGVAMLNKVVEKAMRKCHQYFPARDVTSADGEPLTSLSFGPFHIKLESSVDKGGFVINTLSLSNSESDEPAREVLHFHYRMWPDFHLPNTAEDFLNYLWGLRDSGCFDSDVGSLVVHCSAGIGRSGTLILVDVCLREIELRGDLPGAKIEEYLQRMRRQRFGLIQTPEQLRFAYLAIAEGIERINLPSSAPTSTTGDDDTEPTEAATQETAPPVPVADYKTTEKPAAEATPSTKVTAATADEPAAAAAAAVQDDDATQDKPPCKRQAEEDLSLTGDQPPPKRPAKSPLNSNGQAKASGQSEGATEDTEPGQPLPSAAAASSSQAAAAIIADPTATGGMQQRRGAHSPELAKKASRTSAAATSDSADTLPWSTYVKWSVAAAVVAGSAYAAYRRFLA
ncbi:tyrosine-protein phosphatase non-receptor type 1-like [Sycon ciliatum]|uniref:tyrosine-protein phosphatase non-receptor type 1-like n=1 Tax=Sycon ciliatum TaxID=27933 RepID=UPI0031F6C12B